MLAVRRNKDQVGFSELQEAVERVIAGLEKKNRVLNKMERERVALPRNRPCRCRSLGARLGSCTEDLDHSSGHFGIGLYVAASD